MDSIDTTINRAFNMTDMNWQQKYMIQLMWLLFDTNANVSTYLDTYPDRWYLEHEYN